MKNSHMFMLIALCFCGFFGISKSYKVDEANPAYNVNLAPFIQHISAYYCLQNVSSDCPGNFTLKVGGWLNITANETEAFCGGGCKQHTQDVLRCIKYVKHDYVFENKATLKNLNETINIGCNQGFSGISLTSGSMMTTTSTVTTFFALAFLALFSM